MIKSLFAAVVLSAASTAAFAQTAPAQDHAAHAGHEAHAARPTIESSIKDLLANAETAAVVDKHLPGIAQLQSFIPKKERCAGAVMPGYLDSACRVF